MANETFTVTEAFALVGDTDLDGIVDPGETVRISVQITNNSNGVGATTATGVEFSQILAGMTLHDQPGLDDVNVSPIVFDDSYNVIGNTTYTVSAADGIFGGLTAIHATAGADAEFFGHTIGANPATQTALVTTGTFATAMGGSVTLNADGSFSYSSAAGFTGTDSFVYGVRDVGLDGVAGNGDDLTDSATVSLNVEQSVWFIDNSAAVNGTGTQANPFNSIATFNAVNDGVGVNHPGTGDFVYLREGTGTYSTADGITLLNSQTLVGQGENLAVNHSLQGNIQVATGAAGDTPVILVTGAGNQGIQLAQNNTIRGLDIGMNNATAVGIKDNGGTVGTLTISNVGIGVGNSVGQAIEVDGDGLGGAAGTAGTINILLDSLASSGAGTAVDVASVAGTGNHLTVNGTTTIADAIADGILIGNSSASATFTGKVTILNDAPGANGDGVDLGTNTGTYAFNGGVDITVNGTNAFGFRATTSGTVNILNPDSTNQITSNSGTALFINPTQFNAALTSVTAGDGGSGDGIHLEGVSGSGVTIGSVSINGVGGDGVEITNSTAAIAINGGSIGNTNDAAGIGVDVNGGSGNVTISASVSDATAGGDVIEVTGRSTGTVDFNGAITSAAGGGIDINTNTGGTVRFDGGMNLSTGSLAAFNASGNTGATLVVTGTNVLATSSGTALTVSNTTIGAEDLTFQSISANGAANGIVLNTTGTSGGLTVTGTDGGDAGTVPDAGSGGTIQNTTGDGISLTSTMDVVLGGMTITSNDGDGIGGSGVNGFVLDGATISGNGTSDALDHSGINLIGLTGTALAGLHATEIRNSTISNNHEFEIQVTNSSGTLSDFRVTNSTISSNGATAVHGNLFNFLATGTASMGLTVAGSSFTGNTVAGALTGTGVFADASGGTLTANIGTSTFTNNNNGVAAAAATNGVLSFNIHDNTITGNRGDGLVVFTNANHTATASGTIANNTVGTQGVAGSGSVLGRGIRASNEGSGTTTLLITGNTVQSIADFDGLFVFKGVTGGTMNATITNNIFRDIPGDRGLTVQTGFGPTAILNTSITGNTFINVVGIGGTVARLAELPAATPGTLNVTQASLADLSTLNGGAVFTTGGSSPQFSQPPPPLPLLAGDLPADPLDSTPVDEDDASGDTPGDAPAGDQPPQDQPPAGDAGDAGDGSEPPAPHPVIVDDGILSQAELDWFVDAAVARWIATGLDAEQVAALEGLVFSVTDMAALQLGAFEPGAVRLDDDGAGHGWFLDATPLDDGEFALGSGTQLTATTGSPAVGHYDLLTTIVHEMGHALGLSDLYGDAGRANLMYGYLFVGERRLPGDGEADHAQVGAVTEESFAGSPITVNGTSSTSGAFDIPAGETVTIQWDATIDPQTNQLIVNPVNSGLVTATNAVGFPDVTSNVVTTVLDSLTLGGTVWSDNGAGGGTRGNGLKDGTEAGVNAVAVTLFADTGTVAGVWDASDAQLATGITAGGGNFSFTGLAPGEYIVRIDQSNFNAGAPLVALQASSVTAPEPIDPDNNVDNDDNGARTPGFAAYSNAITLAYNTEPTAGVGNDTNTTLDFGFVAPNAAPTSTNLNGDTATFTEGDATVQPDVANNATIADADSANFDGGSLTVEFTAGEVAAEDSLSIAAVGTITSDATTVSFGGTQFATWTGGSGGTPLVFAFDADATPAAVQALIHAIRYANSGGEDPTDGDRTLTWTLVDGDGTTGGGTDTLVVTTTVDVDSVNDAPAGGDETVVVNEDDSHPFSASDFNFTDTDGDSLQAVVITTLPAAGTLYLNAVAITVAGTVVSVADIAAGLLTFEPAVNANGTGSDSFTFQVRDNGGTDNAGQDTDQTPNTITIDVTAVNDAPVNTVGLTVNASEDAVNVVLSTTGTAMSVSDVEATGNIVYSLSVSNGTLTLRTDVVGGITAGDITGNGTAVISIAATVGEINTTLAASNALLYNPAVNFNGTDTLEVYVNDGGQTGLDTNPASLLEPSSPGIGAITEEDFDQRSIVVAAVDDPAVAQNDAATVAENTTVSGSVFANNGSGADSDIDGPALTVSAVNGVAGNVGTQITLASGALLTVNADGTYAYDPNGQFDYLISAATAAATGAFNTSATDSFTYALAGGGTATVTVTVNGVASAGDELWGNSGNNTITGTLLTDYFDLSQGGDDTVSGLAGDDAFYFGAAFTGADTVDGGAGDNDQIGLEGNYTGGNALVLGASTIANVEVLAMKAGFDYDVTTVDGNVPAGGVLTVFASLLGPGDDFTFDGSAELDGAFRVFGGQGIDLITTGAGDDGIYFGPGKFDPATDRVDGGAGLNDQFALDGHYALTLDGTAIQNIDVIALLKGKPADLATYDLVLANSLTGAGQTMTVWGSKVETALTVDGSLEADGNVRMFGGTLGDTLTGGAGNDWFWGGTGGDTIEGGAGVDTFMYETAGQSIATLAGFDRLVGFNDAEDKIDLGFSVSAFAGPVTATASAGSFGTDLQAGITVLGAGQALLFTANAGDLNTRTFLVIDANGTAGFQAAGDFVIEIVTPVSAIDQLGMFI